MFLNDHSELLEKHMFFIANLSFGHIFSECGRNLQCVAEIIRLRVSHMSIFALTKLSNVS